VETSDCVWLPLSVRPAFACPYTALCPCAVSKEAIRDAYKITLIESSDLSKVAAWSPAAETYENRCSSITRKNRAFLRSELPVRLRVHCP
jgi:hypothetical protein